MGSTIYNLKDTVKNKEQVIACYTKNLFTFPYIVFH